MLYFYYLKNKYFIQLTNFNNLEKSILMKLMLNKKKHEKIIVYDKNNLLFETEEQYENFKSRKIQNLIHSYS